MFWILILGNTVRFLFLWAIYFMIIGINMPHNFVNRIPVQKTQCQVICDCPCERSDRGTGLDGICNSVYSVNNQTCLQYCDIVPELGVCFTPFERKNVTCYISTKNIDNCNNGIFWTNKNIKKENGYYYHKSITTNYGKYIYLFGGLFSACALFFFHFGMFCTLYMYRKLYKYSNTQKNILEIFTFDFLISTIIIILILIFRFYGTCDVCYLTFLICYCLYFSLRSIFDCYSIISNYNKQTSNKLITEENHEIIDLDDFNFSSPEH